MGGAVTILVVDDEPDVLNVTTAMLQSGGYAVIPAQSSDEAIYVLNSGARVDLLISDVIMPHVTGYELARRAKALKPDMKILFTSGYDSAPQNTDEGLPYGKMLWKPFRTSRLLDEVRKLLGE